MKKNKTNIQNVKQCSLCANKNTVTDYDKGEIVCQRCGMVILEKAVDRNPEWRNFLDEGKKVRVGAATSVAKHDFGLSATINPSNKDSTGQNLSEPMRRTFKRLRTWDKRSHGNPVFDRNLQEAFSKLYMLKDKLGLSEPVIERAAYLYRKAIDHNLIRGRSIDHMIVASVYAACRDSETPRTLKEMIKIANVRRKEISNCYRMMVKELDLKMPIADSKQCVTRIANTAGMSEKTKRFSLDLLKKAEKKGVCAGKNPVGLAATALYLSSIICGENHTQKQVAQAGGVTEVTIRNRCKSLKKLLDQGTK
ncbi:MAG: transcription initiation factor IIB family protein [Nitrosopumilaceae archaeon]